MAAPRAPRRLPWALLASGLLHAAAAALTLAPRAAAQTEPPPPERPDVWTDQTVEVVTDLGAPGTPSLPADLPPAPPPERAPPEPAAAPSPPPAPPPPRPPQPVSVAPSPDAPPARPREATPPRPTPPRAPRSPRPAPVVSAAPRRDERARPPSALAAAAPAHSASSGGEPTPGTLGQQGPVTVRDLGVAFTRALPPAGQPDRGWSALSTGRLGTLEVAIDVDAEGKLRGFVPLSKDPPEALVKLVRQALALMRSGFFSLRGPDPSAGRQVVKLAATLDDVPTDVPGGPVALSQSYHQGKGQASFTQVTGRRVRLDIELVRVETAR